MSRGRTGNCPERLTDHRCLLLLNEIGCLEGAVWLTDPSMYLGRRNAAAVAGGRVATPRLSLVP